MITSIIILLLIPTVLIVLGTPKTRGSNYRVDEVKKQIDRIDRQLSRMEDRFK